MSANILVSTHKYSHLFCKKKIGVIFRVFLEFWKNNHKMVVQTKVGMPSSSSLLARLAKY